MRLLLALALSSSSLFAAETIVTKRINEQNRLVPLTKVTVGPDDQYQGMVDATGTTLVFTRKSDLVPRLCTQNLATGQVTDFLPNSADSQQPAVSVEAQVAFAYYRFNARGDVCYRPLAGTADDKVTCLKADEGERSSPFWIGPREIGYVLRDVVALRSRIIGQNIDTGAKQTFADGKVWSPAMKPGGRYFFFNQIFEKTSDTKRLLMMKDLQSGKVKALRFSLPGISGFPAVSEDEKFLYFSHYLNDTNHDGVIDGDDHSVVFRAEIEKLIPDVESFPEQLTSAETNCSFPRPTGKLLYVTCAFEGSLDIYRLPVDGTVPAQWTPAILNNSHQTARTYQERILILNTLKFRDKSLNPTVLDERLLSDHVFADDTTAAAYYLDALQNGAPKDRKTLYALLKVYLEARERKNAQKSEEVTRALENEILAFDARLEKIAGQPRFKSILRGLLHTFVNQPQKAADYLKTVTFATPGHPLERFYFFELASWTLARTNRPAELSAAYREMMTAPELTDESRLYYAFQYLVSLQAAKPSREDRIASIGKMATGIADPVSSLLKAEVATLRIIAAPDDKGKNEAYRDLDALMSSSRADYFLRKAMYVRSIVNFADNAEFKFLDFVATSWIGYTKRNDTEFSQARSVYVEASLDRAYENFAAQKFELAGNYFYGSLSLTDDLESHEGYIRSMVARGARTTVDERYLNLKERTFIDDNMKFVEALLGLIDAKPTTTDTGPFDRALEKLKAMEQDRDSAVRYLLMGYCYLEKLMRSANGYQFDHALYSDAHRSLMLAYDLGRDNNRIKAAALSDLGLLHQRVQNHGLAAKFWAKRRELGFISDEERARVSWLYAKSLFYTYQPDRAADEIDSVLTAAKNKKLQLPASYSLPFQERRAFYLQAAGKFAEASEAYKPLQASVSGDLNLAKLYLGYGYSLFKLKKPVDAATALRKSLDHASRLARMDKDKERGIAFEPARIQLAAYGLLSQVGNDADRLSALEKRSALLDQAKGLTNELPSLIIQNRLQRADLQKKTDGPATAARLREALKEAETLGDAGGYLSRAVYQAAVNYLIHGTQNPSLYRGEKTDTARKIVDNCVKAYESQRQPVSALDVKKVKLKMLWLAFSSQVIEGKKPEADALRKLAGGATAPVELVSLADALAR